MNYSSKIEVTNKETENLGVKYRYGQVRLCVIRDFIYVIRSNYSHYIRGTYKDSVNDYGYRMICNAA